MPTDNVEYKTTNNRPFDNAREEVMKMMSETPKQSYSEISFKAGDIEISDPKELVKFVDENRKQLLGEESEEMEENEGEMERE